MNPISSVPSLILFYHLLADLFRTAGNKSEMGEMCRLFGFHS